MNEIKRIESEYWPQELSPVPGEYGGLSESGRAAFFEIANGASGLNSSIVWLPVSQLTIVVTNNGLFENYAVPNWLARDRGF